MKMGSWKYQPSSRPAAWGRGKNAATRFYRPAVLFIFFGLTVTLSVRTQEAPPEPEDPEVATSLETFSRVYQAVETHYVDPVHPDAAILDGAIRGLLSALDPFSSFFDPDQFQQLRQQQRGKSKGFGSILYVQSGKLVILQTFEGSPTWRAGLGPGDEIVEINGKRVDRLPLRDLVQLLQRSRSQRVRLGIVQSGKILAKNFVLDPAEVSPPSVNLALRLSGEVGYVHLQGFDTRTPQELGGTLRELGADILKGLIMDLRGNRGGVLDSAVKVAGMFLPAGEPVVTLRGRAVPEKTFSTPVPNPHYDFPVVVLVNGESASAAEIVAGALQDHDRAVILGEPSFGKATVQTVLPLSDQMGMALTTAEYLTPSGRSLQRPLGPHRVTGGGSHGQAEPGGGIIPDVNAASWQLDSWTQFLERRTVMINFAQYYLTAWGDVTEDFEVTEKVMERFRDFLKRARIRIPKSAWKKNQAYLKARIQVELLNLTVGLRKGDEAQARHDPLVQKAVEVLSRLGALTGRRPGRGAATKRKSPEFSPPDRVRSPHSRRKLHGTIGS